MKNFVLVWAVWQVIIIGMVCGNIEAQINNGTYACDSGHFPEWEGSVVGALIPLTAFVPSDPRIHEFCAKQETNK